MPTPAIQAVKSFRLKSLSAARLLRPAAQHALSQPGAAPRAVPNPFIPRLNPNTGRWAPPKVSLRQQADLVKRARASGTVGLLPPGPKLSVAEWTRAQAAAQASIAPTGETVEEVKKKKEKGPNWTVPVAWTGDVKERAVAGADIGYRLYAGRKRMFKGHKWERVADARKKKRAEAMAKMARRVEAYKKFYQNRRPRPLEPPRASAKAAKLPF
ncbi:hypothetical protein CONPUDRAFT_167576 [Coniophora puteana RWD-64-598 SS2]|uniref:Large ribosomal subunit protein mL59 domain-containing protein n=1 Tax=Coniophora puteana (strain RWD-64-598) TaxID=741705 RepID=A0A5M3MII3_CONPW|nr:uncharacterized protein CONPUDRAFT_167576 [Coniophora puteana RWD-64-598 SS2]EIW78594.1 hypothetical protein CONPUDRAFT_167576 [Coniophora puteana RWD-64-598 SS2]